MKPVANEIKHKKRQATIVVGLFSTISIVALVVIFYFAFSAKQGQQESRGSIIFTPQFTALFNPPMPNGPVGSSGATVPPYVYTNNGLTYISSSHTGGPSSGGGLNNYSDPSAIPGVENSTWSPGGPNR